MTGGMRLVNVLRPKLELTLAILKPDLMRNPDQAMVSAILSQASYFFP